MGGCATKPKVLKGEEGDAPQPVPEQAGKEETVAAEAKDVAVVDQGVKKVEGDGGGDHEVAKVKEIVEDEKADDQENKPRSLSNLFKTEEGQDSTEAENAPSEPVKEESKETGKPEEESVTKQPEAEKPVTAVEQTAAQEFVDAPEKSLEEKATDVNQATEPKTEDVNSSEAKTEGAKSPEKNIEEEISPEKIIEVVKSPEKITEEAKSPEVKTEDAKPSEKIIDDSQSAEKIIENLSEGPTLSSGKSM